MRQLKPFVSQLLLKELSCLLGKVQIKKTECFASILWKENISSTYFNTPNSTTKFRWCLTECTQTIYEDCVWGVPVIHAVLSLSKINQAEIKMILVACTQQTQCKFKFFIYILFGFILHFLILFFLVKEKKQI